MVPKANWLRDSDRIAPYALAQGEGTPGDDHLHGRRSPDTISGLDGNDVLNGRDGDDILDGGKGDDLLRGSGGRDVLTGGGGDDRLYGGTEQQDGSFAGRDQLDGGSGDDRLFGGYEGDVLTGGVGKDRFSYTALTDSTTHAPDSIIDFEQGKDKIVFRDEFRDVSDLHFIGNDAFSQTPGEVRYEIQGSNLSAVYVDVDGDGAADTFIALGGQIDFQARNFSF